MSTHSNQSGTQHDPAHRPAEPGPPTLQEIAELAARLRRLTSPGAPVEPHERAQFLADKAALLARIERSTRDAGTARTGGDR